MSSGVVTINNSHIVSLEGCLAWKHHCLSQRYRGNKQTNLYLSFVEFKKDGYTAADSNSEAMVCNIAQICIRNNSIHHTPPTYVIPSSTEHMKTTKSTEETCHFHFLNQPEKILTHINEKIFSLMSCGNTLICPWMLSDHYHLNTETRSHLPL